MEKFSLLVHDEINKFGVEYSGSEVVDDLIELKHEFDEWFIKRAKTVKNFYITKKSEKCSFKLESGKFELRLTFYKGGRSTINLQHARSSTLKLKKHEVIDAYDLDVGYVYFIKSEFGWKIGKTKSINSRRKTFEVKLPFEFQFVYHVKTWEKSALERRLHKYFKDKLINGEWYNITKEDIYKSADDLDYYFHKTNHHV